MKNATSNFKSVPSIDDVDPSLIKNLAVFWKCDEGRGLVWKDYSGNGYDLAISCHASESTDPTHAGSVCGKTDENLLDILWNSFDGYFTPYAGMGAAIDAVGTLLDTQGKYVVWGCEQIADFTKGNADFDSGTYWGGSYGNSVPNPFPQQSGFNWALSFTQHWFRLSWDVNGTEYSVPITDLEIPVGHGLDNDPPSQDYVGTFPDNTPVGVAAAFLPSTSFKACMQVQGDRPSGVVTKTTSFYPDTSQPIPATLEAQDGKFMIRGQDVTDTVGPWNPSSAMRNFYVWTFDSEPPFLDEALQFLAQYPGKIPPWWIGL